ncbi:MAG: pyridoxamine 5'-phosphate oxidase family protein [Desulfobacterota bacterium]|nr:pyridoxamine 5'-phosphate oxidase family protein [Thermodesulfobacteriota bacterium]
MKVLLHEEIEHLLTTVNDGVLAFTDGRHPYCIPFGFVFVGGTVYLSMFPRGRKWEYLQKNPLVCFNAFCWNNEHTEWYSVVVEGELEIVTDLQVIETVVRANIKKSGLDPTQYLEKRMEYYRNSTDNPKALKIFKIKASSVTGRTMHTLIGS